MKIYSFFLGLLLIFNVQAQKSNFDKRADALIKQMTLDEKLGQLNLPSSGDFTTGQTKSSDIAQKIREGKVGGLFNIKGVEKIKAVQEIAVNESRLKIPLLFGMDVIHGYESTFPIPLGLSCTWDMNIIEESARTAAREATSDGINWTFSPMVDISRDPRWGRMAEGAGEDPYLGSQIAQAMVKGYQGDDLSSENTMLACVKHFALYGAAEAGRDYNTVDMSTVRMYNDYFPPYKAAVDAGAESVMASFNEVNGIPATGNKWLMHKVLRNQWGFDGFIVTDYTGINEMIAHGMGDLQECSRLALDAGMDMDMVGEGFLTTLPKSLEDKKITIKQIDAAVKRILIAKMKLGLFEDPFKYCNPERSKSEVYNETNRKKAQNAAAKSMVLLKNENQLLPLKKNGTIALIGPLTNNAVNMAGTWSVASVQARSVTLLEGLKEAVGSNAQILQASGSKLDYNDDFIKNYTVFGKGIVDDGKTQQELISDAMEIAQKSDVIVACLGETAEMSGESSSRTRINIPAAQRELLDALLTLKKPVVLCVLSGRPLVLVEENKKVNAMLQMWYPGSEAGYALADVLFGKVNPSAKLSVTFPRDVGQIPIYYAHKNTGRPLSEKATEKCLFEKFRSDYLDECNTPLFPFGYGLSYTQFEYSDFSLSADEMSKTGQITAKVKVTNKGKYDGEEIVQLYIRDMVGSITRPVKELKGFQKIFLRRGQSQWVQFKITDEILKFYNQNLEYASEPGVFEVFIGKDSAVQENIPFTLTN